MATAKKSEFKHSPIGPIPSDWDIRELAEIVDKTRPISYGIVQTGESVPNGVKCIRVIDLINGKINSENLITTSKKISDGYKRTILRKGDLVLALRGKLGEIAIVEENLIGANLTRGVALIATNESIDKEFLKQQISSPRTKIVLEKSLNGSALQEISIGVLRKITVVLPNLLKEQRAISAALLTWDKAIEKTTKLIAVKEQRKKWLMQKLLTGKKRLKGFGDEWRISRIGDVGKVVTGNTPETKDADNYGDDYFFVGPSDLGNGKYILDTEKKLSKKGFDSSRQYPIGAVLFTCIGSTIGKAGIANRALTSNQQINAIFCSSDYNNEFIYYQLEFLAPKIKLIASAQAVPIINKSQFEDISLNTPTLKEQTAIVEILQIADKEISILKQKLEAYKEQKKGLMQVLLTGKVRLKI
jgi:type I restriction enzyme S subunit